MSYLPIVPAVIPHSAAEVYAYTKTLSFAKEFHLDVLDGIFVAAPSWPYDPSGEPMEVKSFLDVFTLEVDLMVDSPLLAAKQWITAGADMLVFHVETVQLEAFKAFTEHCSVSVGIAAHGADVVSRIEPYLAYADYVQVMGIKEIGAQSQPFDESVVETIAALKHLRPHLSVTVDGSVNKETIKKLAKAGADRFITGSAVVLQDSPQAAQAELMALING